MSIGAIGGGAKGREIARADCPAVIVCTRRLAERYGVKQS